MTNGYFNHDAPLARHTLARAEELNAKLTAVAVGFDRLPPEAMLKQGRVTYGSATGTVDSYTVTLPHAPTAYAEGMRVTFRVPAGSGNSGACSVNVNGLGVKPILRIDGAATIPGDLPTGGVIDLCYDGTAFRLAGTHGGDVRRAQDWAGKADGPVVGGGYSAMAWASLTGSAAPPSGSARQWAESTGGLIGGVGYSAREHATGTAVPEGSARAWAEKTGASVDGSGHSAREHATGDTVPTGSAKAWATKTDGPVSGGVEYSAKYHAGRAALSEAAASASASASASAAASSAADAVVAAGQALVATSSTSLSVSTGAKALTVTAGRGFAPGQPVSIAQGGAAATVVMYGTVAAYNAVTGALAVTVSSSVGSGTYTAWTVSVTGVVGPASTQNTGPFSSIISVSSDTTLSPSHLGKAIEVTGGAPVVLSVNPATVGPGSFGVVNLLSGGRYVTVSGGGAAINGDYAITLSSKQGVIITSDGARLSAITMSSSAPSSQYFDPSRKSSSIALSNNNLTATGSASGTGMVLSANYLPAGRWCWGVLVASAGQWVGVATDSANLSTYVGGDSKSWGYGDTGQKSTGGVDAAYGSAVAPGGEIMVLIEVTSVSTTTYNAKVWFKAGGVVQGGGDPLTGANPAFTLTNVGPLRAAWSDGVIASTPTGTLVLTQAALAQTMPAGFSTPP